MQLLVSGGIAFILAASSCFAAGGESYTKGMFKEALKDDSSSPLYLLVNVPKYGKRDVCVQAPFLLTAISLEHGFAFDRVGVRQAVEFALRSFGKPLHFSDTKAEQVVKPRYGQEQLMKAERFLAVFRKDEISKELGASGSRLHAFYAGQRDASARIAYRDALACVMLNRGILVGVQDRTGRLFIR